MKQKFFATFGLGGPLKNRYGVIFAETEDQARIYLKEHFPVDWAGIYKNEDAFWAQVDKYELKEAFVKEI